MTKRCPACGSEDLWSEEHLAQTDVPVEQRNAPENVVIVYQCQNCEWEWREKPE